MILLGSELNGDRSNFRYGMIAGLATNYGQCDFKVDFAARRAEPKADKKGDVARIYFYMRDRYGLTISRQQTQLFTAWDKMDPPDALEQQRDQRITKIQGNSNCYVTKKCSIEKAPIITVNPAKLVAKDTSCLPEKRFCYQMTSCNEAKHYLTACGLSALDRNKDGIPCESLCN
jgi:deoxyribonuclease-1